MENRKRNVQIIIRVTEEERALIEEKMQQIPTLNLSAYARKILIDGYIIALDLQEVKGAYGAASENRREHQSDCKAYQRNRTNLRRRHGRDKTRHGRSLAIGTAIASAIQKFNEMRVWDTSQQAKCSGGRRAFYENGYPFSMLAIQFYL